MPCKPSLNPSSSTAIFSRQPVRHAGFLQLSSPATRRRDSENKPGTRSARSAPTSSSTPAERATFMNGVVLSARRNPLALERKQRVTCEHHRGGHVETRSRTYTPNMGGTESESFFAISTGRTGSPARPSRNVQAKPISVALIHVPEMRLCPACAKIASSAARESRKQHIDRHKRQQQQRKPRLAQRFPHHRPAKSFQRDGIAKFVKQIPQGNSGRAGAGRTFANCVALISNRSSKVPKVSRRAFAFGFAPRSANSISALVFAVVKLDKMRHDAAHPLNVRSWRPSPKTRRAELFGPGLRFIL